MTTTDPIRLDVRAVAASGGERFELLMTTVGRIAPDGAVELTAPFEPVPLYPIVCRCGYAPTAEARGPAEWVVMFRNTGSSPAARSRRSRASSRRREPCWGWHGLDLCCGGTTPLRVAA